MPVSEAAVRTEQKYYELLIAQRELALARANSKMMENRWSLASASEVSLKLAAGHDKDLMESAQVLATATSRVKELTASLNSVLGWPADTELVVPTGHEF